MSIRIVLADDHVLLRQGLRMLLEDEPDIAVIAEADNGLDAIEQALRHRPDVVLMDVTMPELDGISATHQLHDQYPEVRVVILSGADEETAVIAAVRAGAIGFLRKRLQSMFWSRRSAQRLRDRSPSRRPPRHDWSRSFTRQRSNPNDAQRSAMRALGASER